MNKYFLTKFFIIFLFFSSAFSAQPQFTHKYIFELAKDQKAFLHITEKNTQIKESFELAWTLYDGLNLVFHSRWRNYPKQFTLSLRQGLKLYSQSILSASQHPYRDEVRVFVEFVSFENNKAKIQVLILDEGQRIELDYFPKK